MRLDYETLVSLRRHHSAWRLLRSDHAELWFQVPSATGVNDLPALAFEPTAAFRCKPEAGSETRGFFEVDYSFAMPSHSGRLE